MLRRLTFYLLRKLINDDKRKWVFVDLEEGIIMNWEVEKLELKIENETKKDKNSPYNYDKMFIDTKMLMNMELNGLWIDAPIK